MTRMIDRASVELKPSKITILLGLVLLLVSFHSFGQNASGSVYSMFGIGELNQTTSVQSRGMGYASIGLSSKYDVNLVNPAANDQLGYYFNHMTNIGFYYASTNYKTDDASENGSYGGISNFNFWFKIGNKWSSIVGLGQYSNVGYNINQRDVNSFQSSDYSVLHQGSGGLNEFYFSNGYSIVDNLSLGLKLAFVFGNIEHTEWAASSQNSQQFYISDQVNIKDVYAEYSLNYRIQRPKFDVNFGLIFKNENTLKGSTSSQITSQNTTSGEVDLIYEDQESTDDYVLPRKYGFGFSVNTEKILLAGDVEYNQWSQAHIPDYENDLNDTWRYSLGLELTPNRASESYMSRVSYRIGGYTENSYLKIDGTTFSQYGITGGLSMPLRTGSAVNVAYQRKLNGTVQNNLIYESTNEISINLTIRNRWFQQRKFN
ncbi:hypothetical protein N6H18_07620 [Reichenbachiella agarivorans]|uniref:Long-chain fatty acid transport protein n=1 Tax=Reichenbachiella agarivorans TaxID=2979464 RepID=A0ABY6CTG8_9BACT|nr:hypothetical protein [Reichenbachiella agarivorans]UXP33815.1 hypothetical protein N6H18_07620 [Reichenbachiella agarivorans]